MRRKLVETPPTEEEKRDAGIAWGEKNIIPCRCEGQRVFYEVGPDRYVTRDEFESGSYLDAAESGLAS